MVNIEGFASSSNLHGVSLIRDMTLAKTSRDQFMIMLQYFSNLRYPGDVSLPFEYMIGNSGSTIKLL